MAAIKAVLENVSDYPHRERYLAWPGPNSNIFASWVLRRAGIRHRIGLEDTWQTLLGGVTPGSTGDTFVGVPARYDGQSRMSSNGQ